MKKKLLSLLLSIMVAISFMPMAADLAFAFEENTEEALADETETGSDETGDFGALPKESQEEGETPKQEEPAFEDIAVAGLALASYNYKSVTLAWEAVEDAEGYQVYRAKSRTGSYKRIATTEDLKYKDADNKTMGVYRYYKVRAHKTVDDVKVYGAFSEILAAKPNLPATASLKATAQTSAVKLSWSKVYGAKGYYVYRATSPDGKYKRLKTTSKLYFTNSSVTKGKKYYYKVKAYKYVNGKKKSGKYSTVTQGASKPSVPKAVSAECSEGQILVKWNSVSRADYYVIYRSTDKYSGFKSIGTSYTTEYVEQDELVSGKYYYYKVSAAVALEDKDVIGAKSIGQDRGNVVTQAKEWHGAVECGSTQKTIVGTYNNYKNRVGARVGYRDAWCATFVSAVFIKAGVGDLVRCDCYCPSMMKGFSVKKSRSYAPTGGDVIFYDWNYNNVPDHVGLITGYDSKKCNVTAIEGNTTCDKKSKKDHVAYRTFKKGWRLVLKYGIPDYHDGYKVKYVAAEKPEPADTLGCSDEKVIEDPVKASAVAKVQEVIREEPAADEEETLEDIVEYIQEENPAGNRNCEESVYDAFLLMDACENNGIEASVITTVDEDGNMVSYNEIMMDGTLYMLDASEEGTLTEITPEEIN